MLRANRLTIEYVRPLFRDLSFILSSGDKVGLIGLNGCGKSTLLKIIAGEEKPDAGRVEIVGEKLGYLPQEFKLDDSLLVGEFLEGLVSDPVNEMYKVNIVLAQLEYQPDHFQYVRTLSEGQKMKLFLTKLLMEEPTILLLDEPTNHLDIEGIIWFEKFVQRFPGGCLIISHDRAFLNNTVNKIFEIDEQQLYVFTGNYDDYIEAKEQFKEERARQVVLHERKRKQLEERIKLARKMTSGLKQKRAVSAAKKRLEREVLSREVHKYKEQVISGLSIEGSVNTSKKILELKDVSFAYDKKKPLLLDVDFVMHGREKVWFYGANGIGKTTVIKLITGLLTPDSGEIQVGENVRMEYFSQDQSHLPLEMKLQEYFLEQTGVSYDRSFSTLQQFLFSKDMLGMPIGKLSPGQRARLSFAVFAQHEYEFLILDEPTNHLDVRSREVIEEALARFQGAILLISHDRYFVENIGIDRMVTLNAGQLVET